jgi:hypothetical protein
LLHGSGTWTIKARDVRKITAAEMKYMRITAGYTWTDHKTKHRDCKGIKCKPSFGKNTGLPEELDTQLARNRLPRY